MEWQWAMRGGTSNRKKMILPKHLHAYRTTILVIIVGAAAWGLVATLGIADRLVELFPGNPVVQAKNWLREQVAPIAAERIGPEVWGVITSAAEHLSFLVNPAILLAVAYGAVKVWPLQRLGEVLLPSPPSFLDMALELPEADRDDVRAKARPFVERETEMAALVAFAAAEPGFRWWSIYGTGGVGKSRLAVEWLRHLEKARPGWDAGILRLPGQVADIEAWTPRRSTAIVLDDAWRWAPQWPEVLAALERAQRRSRSPIRVLLIDTAAHLPPSEGEAGMRKALDRSFYRSGPRPQPRAGEAAPLPLIKVGIDPAAAFRIEPLQVKSAVPRLAEAFGVEWETPQDRDQWIEQVSVDTDGLPALLVPLVEGRDELQREVAERAAQLLSNAARVDPSGGANLIVLSALCGPVAHENRRPPLDKPSGLPVLQKLFPNAPQSRLKKELPLVKPELLARQLTMQGLSAMEAPTARSVVEAAYAIDPTQVARRSTAIINADVYEAAVNRGSSGAEESKTGNGEAETIRHEIIELLNDARARQGLGAYCRSLDEAYAAIEEATSRGDGIDLDRLVREFGQLVFGSGKHAHSVDAAAGALARVADLLCAPGNYWRGNPSQLSIVDAHLWLYRSGPLVMPPHILKRDGTFLPVYKDIGWKGIEFGQWMEVLLGLAQHLLQQQPKAAAPALTLAKICSHISVFWGLACFQADGQIAAPPNLVERFLKMVDEARGRIHEIVLAHPNSKELADLELQSELKLFSYRLQLRMSLDATTAEAVRTIDELMGEVAINLKAFLGYGASPSFELLWHIVRAMLYMTIARDRASDKELLTLMGSRLREEFQAIVSTPLTVIDSAESRRIGASMAFAGMLLALEALDVFRYDTATSAELYQQYDRALDGCDALLDRSNDEQLGTVITMVSGSLWMILGGGSSTVYVPHATLSRLAELKIRARNWCERHANLPFSANTLLMMAGGDWRRAASKIRDHRGTQSEERDAAVRTWLDGLATVRELYQRYPNSPFVLFDYVTDVFNFMGWINSFTREDAAIIARHYTAIEREVETILHQLIGSDNVGYLHEEIARGIVMFAGDAIGHFSANTGLVGTARLLIEREYARFPQNEEIKKRALHFCGKGPSSPVDSMNLKLPSGMKLVGWKSETGTAERARGNS